MLVVNDIADLIPLSQLGVGCCAIVAAVLGGAEQVHRLHEMGLRHGEAIEMVQPGAPCILKLGNQRLGFRADELLSVLVKPGIAV